jgi:hypothetical protein
MTTDADQILKALWDNLCSPILSVAGPNLSTEQQTALMIAPLFIVQTAPARVGLFGWGDVGPVSCGSYEVSAVAGAAVAEFFEAGLRGPLDAKLRPIVTKLLDEKSAQLVATLRPDKGEATALLIAHGDRHPPIALFMLKTSEPEIRH